MAVQLEPGRVEHKFEPVVLVAALAIIPVLIVQHDATSDMWQSIATIANMLIWLVFAAEFVLVGVRGEVPVGLVNHLREVPIRRASAKSETPAAIENVA